MLIAVGHHAVQWAHPISVTMTKWNASAKAPMLAEEPWMVLWVGKHHVGIHQINQQPLHQPQILLQVLHYIPYTIAKVINKHNYYLPGDYFLAEGNQSCEEACQDIGYECDLTKVINDINNINCQLLERIEFQVQSASTSASTCQNIIDSLGYSANSRFGGSQAFDGGGCTHQTRNNWYQVMKPSGGPVTCEAKENRNTNWTPWQRVCACMWYLQQLAWIISSQQDIALLRALETHSCLG